MKGYELTNLHMIERGEGYYGKGVSDYTSL